MVEHEAGVTKGLLTSKSRISKRSTLIARLELVSGHMAANMVKNLCTALQRWTIKSNDIWMDSIVALYLITNPGRGWKVFVANRVKKIAETASLINITWTYCPSELNLADLGSRGSTIVKKERGNWFTGPDWLLDIRRCPEQPRLNTTKETDEEIKVTQEAILRTQERKFDEWDALLERHLLACNEGNSVGLCRNCKVRNKLKKTSGPIFTEETTTANDWVKRVQKAQVTCLQSPS